MILFTLYFLIWYTFISLAVAGFYIGIWVSAYGLTSLKNYWTLTAYGFIWPYMFWLHGRVWSES